MHACVAKIAIKLYILYNITRAYISTAHAGYMQSLKLTLNDSYYYNVMHSKLHAFMK